MKKLINCETNLILTWWSTYVINSSIERRAFSVTDTKLYVLVGFKSIFRLLSNEQKKYLHYLFDPSLQRVTRLFVLSFKNNGNRIRHIVYTLPKVEKKDYINIDKPFLISHLKVIS